MKKLQMAMLMVFTVALFGCKEAEQEETNTPDSYKSTVSGLVLYCIIIWKNTKESK